MLAHTIQSLKLTQGNLHQQLGLFLSAEVVMTSCLSSRGVVETRQTMKEEEASKRKENLISMLKRKMSYVLGWWQCRNLLVFFLMTFLTFFLFLSNSRVHLSFHCCDQDRTIHQPEYEGSYGPGFSKVIAFTYFKGISKANNGISRKYVEGIRGNLQAIHQIYGPEWTMRLYHNLAAGDPLLEKELRPLSNLHNQQFVLCDINHNPLLGNASILWPPTLWRFLPLLDDQVQLQKK